MRLPPVVWLAVAYLIGSIPFAYLAGRLLKGIDLRRHGSGNLGATNVARVIGWPAALAVFVSDAAKGALPVWLFPRWSDTEHPEMWAIAYGIAAIAGHVRPAFLGWTPGGKGVATAAGVFLALAPRPTLVATAVFAILFGIWRYVSLASLGAAVTLPIAMAVDRGPSSPLFVVSALVCAFVFWTHRSNIERLRHGQEHRFGRKSPA